MTKKHFIEIAKTIKALRAQYDDESAERIAVDAVVYRLCDTFQSFNPLFDRERFQNACKE